MTVILVVLAVVLLVGAVVFGLVRNNRSGGKPAAGHSSDGTPRASS